MLDSQTPALTRIGFVPLIDAAPLILAQENGFFEARGHHVELVREPGWATIRDKMAYGELDAAHALAGLCFAISWGLGVTPTPCLTGFLFNSHGDAITVSRRLYEEGVRDAPSLARWLRRGRDARIPTLAVPHPFSAHHYLLRQYLKPHGIQPCRDYEIISLPPGQMNRSLASGHIDGFCVGEPYGTEAVQRGLGHIVATSADLAPRHPEKALIVTQNFEDERPEAHRGIIRALAEGCKLCASAEGRSQVANILSRKEYLGLAPSVLQASLHAHYAEFHLFYGRSINRPGPEKANWLMSQMRLAGLLEGVEKDVPLRPSIAEIFRSDLFDEVLDGEGDVRRIVRSGG